MEKKYTFDEIQNYLNSEMSSEAVILFEETLEENEDLKNDLNLFKDIEADLGNTELEEFKKKIKSFSEKKTESIFQNSNQTFSLFRKVVSIAASILLIAFAGWWIINQNNTVLDNELVALANDNFIHYPAQEESRGNEVKSEIYASYEAKEYQLAAITLEQFGIENNSQEALFFAAISYIGINNNEKAIDLLLDLDKTSFLANKIQYYLGLAYLKQGKKTKAINALKLINKSDIFLYDRAKKVLEKVK